MLVLSRRVGDEITLPELGVTIRLLKMKGNTACLGVQAPREYTVLRGELSQFESASVGNAPGRAAATA